MVKMTITARSNLLNDVVHDPSKSIIHTDAPMDVGGGATFFSPTDLVGAGLVSCILTTMGLVANKIGVDLTGATGSVEKEMTNDKPRRIGKVTVILNVPVPQDHPERERLERAAHHCPVHHSLHPDIIKDIQINFIG